MDILALLLLGTLTGNEIAIGAFVHPVLSNLPDDQHAASTQAIAKIYGKLAPFWYAATLLALIALAWRTSKNQPRKNALAASAALMFGAVVFTLVGPAPINSRVANWDLKALPTDWKSDRILWDKLHAGRTVALLASFISLALGTTRK